MSANGRPIRDLRLDAALNDLRDALDGTLRMTGDIAGKPLRAEAHIARQNRSDYALDRLAFALGSVLADGQAVVNADSLLAEGALTVRAGDLGDLSPLALAPKIGRAHV